MFWSDLLKNDRCFQNKILSLIQIGEKIPSGICVNFWIELAISSSEHTNHVIVPAEHKKTFP